MSPAPSRAFPVLVVDSDPDTATSLADYLRLRGFDAQPATSGLAASALIADWHPSAAVVHLGLSPMTGYELAARLCDLSPRRPLLIATTVSGTEAEYARASAFGFDYVLVTPFDPGGLADLLVKYAGGRAG